MDRLSDGMKHERLALPFVIFLIVLSGVLAFYSISLAFGVCIGALCAFIIDPDLDQRGATRAENRMYRVPFVGALFGAVFQMYWIPYALIPHGSVLSHGGKNKLTGWITMALVATPLRMLYANLWLLIYLPMERFRIYLSWIPFGYWVGLYLAWATIDQVHWFRDRWLD